ncbi:hypothetical protein [Microlunatus flavus]|uniref:Peptide methionine sulfoxide reductase n=1 Tax=Microlunatus flavus TaxID=1036181 RepID=A0A1H9H720_9ACTN|nr:hypothetical protein [Microlunatus flavus]SEQ58018.1 hypothetical protein SAMN05421756_104137 [Microlunatus flavus]
MTDPVAPEPAPGAGDEADADAVGADDLARLVDRVPPGWTEVAYGGRTWGLSRTDRAEGRTTTLWAEELGGLGFVSANVWRTSGGEVLRPCEMPAETVLDLLRGWTPHEDGQGDH